VTPAAAEAVYFAGPPRWDRGELLSRLRLLLAQRVEQAYLFGSYGRGTADADSDVDLILVARTQAPWPRRVEAFADLWSQLGPVDVLVYTPREWMEMRASQHPFLEATAGERVGVFE